MPLPNVPQLLVVVVTARLQVLPGKNGSFQVADPLTHGQRVLEQASGVVQPAKAESQAAELMAEKRLQGAGLCRVGGPADGSPATKPNGGAVRSLSQQGHVGYSPFPAAASKLRLLPEMADHVDHDERGFILAVQFDDIGAVGAQIRSREGNDSRALAGFHDR